MKRNCILNTQLRKCYAVGGETGHSEPVEGEGSRRKVGESWACGRGGRGMGKDRECREKEEGVMETTPPGLELSSGSGECGLPGLS